MKVKEERFVPAYRKLSDREFRDKIEAARGILAECRLCPRECGVNRLEGDVGVCRCGLQIKVSSAGPHFGEEPELVGIGGSGTIFLTSCNLKCIFCQNYEISWLGEGYGCSIESVAQMMLSLQRRGCHNINLVTPTHFMPQLLEAIYLASKEGLELPIVYNCGGYESLEALRILDGVVDIYMPDLKYGDNAPGARYSGVKDYFDRAKEAIKEMHRQVGDLKVDRFGIAKRGLIIRHLVMPNNVARTDKVLKFIASEISPHSYVNVMDQYRPTFRANLYPEINRRITRSEYLEALSLAKSLIVWHPEREG
ncbi:TPA: radical SAM protein [Candidatus Poribacteria bacterium]|nr:radical SAM protein [Candidatus Poribacteria bacterium]